MKSRASAAFYVLFAVISSSPPSAAHLTLQEENDSIRVITSAGASLDNVNLYFRLSGKQICGKLQSAGEDQGEDSAGPYRVTRYSFLSDLKPADNELTVNARLEVRNYVNSDVAVGLLAYKGPSLDAKGGIEVGLELPAFGRGMAMHRLKLWWPSPVFVSDPRVLPGSNQLLLWKQTSQAGYHLLIPLAGDGMVGDLRVSDFQHLRICMSSFKPGDVPNFIPLFAYTHGDNPYALVSSAYKAAFCAAKYYGCLR